MSGTTNKITLFMFSSCRSSRRHAERDGDFHYIVSTKSPNGSLSKRRLLMSNVPDPLVSLKRERRPDAGTPPPYVIVTHPHYLNCPLNSTTPFASQMVTISPELAEGTV
jgi:hypothetical protein